MGTGFLARSSPPNAGDSCCHQLPFWTLPEVRGEEVWGAPEAVSLLKPPVTQRGGVGMTRFWILCEI